MIAAFRLSISTLCVLIAGQAWADPSAGAKGTPVDYAKRGLVLGQGGLRADLAPRDFGLGFGGVGGRSITQDVPGLRIGRRDSYVPGLEGVRAAPEQTILQLTVGAGFGVTDELEVGTVLLPVHIAPNGDFGDIEFYGRYALLQGEVDVGAQLTLALPTNTRFGIGLGAPVIFRMGPVRIDTGAELELLFGDDTAVDLDLPVAVAIDVGDGFFFGIRSGFFVPDFEHLALPLMVHAGYTLISGQTPFIDLVGSFGWSRFLWTGGGDNLDLDTFDLILGARIFVDVM